MEKRFIAALLCAVMAIALLTGCKGASEGNTADGSEKKDVKEESFKVGYATKTLSGGYFVKLNEGLEAGCKELGWEFVSMNEDRNADTERANLEAMVSQGCDLIFLNCVDPDSAVANVRYCVDNKVPVIAVDGGCADDADLITTVYSDNKQNGRMVGLAYAEYMKDRDIRALMISGSKGDVAGYERRMGLFCGIIEGKSGVSEEDAWKAADVIEQALIDTGKAENEDAKFYILGQGWSGWSEDGGLQAAEDLITANQDITTILGENDDMVIGAGVGVANAKLENVELVAAADGSQKAYDLIKEGKYFATGENSPVLVGELAIDIAKQVLVEGKTKDDFESVTMTSALAVTKGNVDERYDYGF